MTEPQSGGTAATTSQSGDRKIAMAGSSRTSILRFAVLAAMLCTLFLLFQYPLHRISSDSEINFNEGWNAYRQSFAREGTPLYGTPPDLATGATNYPPISFHLVSMLSFHGDVVKTARWISVISLFVTALL